ncbi:LLM class flavin-dependent oxidoreductase [Streptomyces sp. NPDC020379]|uniref:LLM class flavin-dependent oxidoreductase n=1 Tax=Streptomyces sp. NPDC020379 TaxID=3365071 RepID=UPI003791EB26
MRHGISLLPDCRRDRRSAADYYRDVLALTRFADRAGIDYVKMTEHYLGEYGGYCPSPLTFLAAAAAQTTDIRLMTGATLPAFHHPIQLAAHISMVDALSEGRLDVGLGRAWLPYEFEALGVPIDESRPRFEATTRAMLRLWTEENVTEDTPFFSYRDATSLPPVTQSPHPPLWGAAVRSPESFTWLGEHGLGVMLALAPLKKDVGVSRYVINLYRDAFTPGDGGHAAPRIALSTPLYVARTDDEAYRAAEPLYREYMAVWSEAAASWKTTTSDQYAGYDQMGAHARHLTDFDVRRHGTAVIGSPGTVAERILALREEYGVDTFLWQVDFGGQNLDQMQASLRLYVDEVLPRL